MTHDSKALTLLLVSFIIDNVDDRSTFVVSSAKQDGSVFVRFKSTSEISSEELAERFAEALDRVNKTFIVIDTNKFRLMLCQFV